MFRIPAGTGMPAARELRISHTLDARGGIELDLDSGPGTHEGAGLLTTYGDLGW